MSSLCILVGGSLIRISCLKKFTKWERVFRNKKISNVEDLRSSYGEALEDSLKCQPAKKTYINTQYNNIKQTKRKKLPQVQTSNWTFKINPQIKEWKQRLQNKLESTTREKKSKLETLTLVIFFVSNFVFFIC